MAELKVSPLPPSKRYSRTPPTWERSPTRSIKSARVVVTSPERWHPVTPIGIEDRIVGMCRFGGLRGAGDADQPGCGGAESLDQRAGPGRHDVMPAGSTKTNLGLAGLVPGRRPLSSPGFRSSSSGAGGSAGVGRTFYRAAVRPRRATSQRLPHSRCSVPRRASILQER